MNHKRIATPYSGNPSRLRDTEGTIGQHQNKTYNSYQSRSSINPKTKDIYSKHHRMATHHWIIICGIKHHVQVGITTVCGRCNSPKIGLSIFVLLFSPGTHFQNFLLSLLDDSDVSCHFQPFKTLLMSFSVGKTSFASAPTLSNPNSKFLEFG